MLIKTYLNNIQLYLFYALLFALPFNLGKHFLHKDVYIGGLFVDYLVPTLYVQDIIIILLVGFWLFSSILHKGLPKTPQDLPMAAKGVLLVFVFASLISIFFSVNHVSSLHVFLRILLYLFLVLFIYYETFLNNKKETILMISSVSVFLVCLLGLVQWYLQSSVFDNYLFFGEQPYKLGSFGIVTREFFERAVVPPYGTFRHPNTFGGFLSIFLVYIFIYLLRIKNLKSPKTIWYLNVFFVGGLVLLLTLSKIALVAFVLGTVLVLLDKYITQNNNLKYTLLGLIMALTIAFSFSLPLISDKYLSVDPSFYRRGDLQTLAIESIKDNLFFGIGLGNAAYVSSSFTFSMPDFKFPQPVHNIFLLIFTEIGVFGFLAFLVGIALLFYSAPFVFKVILLQVIFIGSFDHYILTMHQTLLLFCLTIGFCLKYTFSVNIKK